MLLLNANEKSVQWKLATTEETDLAMWAASAWRLYNISECVWSGKKFSLSNAAANPTSKVVDIAWGLTQQMALKIYV